MNHPDIHVLSKSVIDREPLAEPIHCLTFYSLEELETINELAKLARDSWFGHEIASSMKSPNGDDWRRVAQAVARRAAATERETCARLAEGLGSFYAGQQFHGKGTACSELAKLIRNRGVKSPCQP